MAVSERYVKRFLWRCTADEHRQQLIMRDGVRYDLVRRWPFWVVYRWCTDQAVIPFDPVARHCTAPTEESPAGAGTLALQRDVDQDTSTVFETAPFNHSGTPPRQNSSVCTALCTD